MAYEVKDGEVAIIVRESLADAGVTVSGTIPRSINEATMLFDERPVVVMGRHETRTYY